MKVVDSYAELARTRAPEHLAGPVLRTKSAAARAIYGRLATAGECDYEAIIAALAVTGAPPAAAVNGVKKRAWLAELARVMAAQGVYEQDPSHALMLFEAIVARAGTAALTSDQQAVYGQLLYRLGELERLTDRLPALRKLQPLYSEYLRIDLANPFVRTGQDEAAWLRLMNAPFTRAGLEPVHLLHDGPTPFDRLAATVSGAVPDGPLVSVVMSAYRPGEALFSAVRSILEQSWRNLELIVVDDASGPRFDETFAAVTALDDRVRIIRLEANGGTYVARNVGLDAARGEFVTFQDSDDWSHPRRLELQVAGLLENPERIATRSLAVRAHDDLHHQWLCYPAQRVNASSLMFRREPVLAKVGYFDSVRKSADLEYAFRLEAAHSDKITDIPLPLAYTRLTQASLSRSDFTFGWAAPARIAYQAAYQYWHKAIADGANPYLPRTPEQRPFPAPGQYLRGISPAPAARSHYDVLLLDDWVSYFDGVDGGLEQLRILTKRGLAVGLVHAEPVARTAPRRQHVDDVAQSAINAGVIDRVTLDQEVTASLVIVRDPVVLQFTQAAAATVRAERVVICNPRQPVDYPGIELAYDEQDCSAGARALFGVEPRWEPGLDLTPVEERHWWTSRTRRRSDRPVIGQCAPDGPFAWPKTQKELLLAYPEFGDVDVRVLGGAATADRFRQLHDEATQVVYRRDQISLRAFLNQLDFFVCFPSAEVTVPPVDVIAMAMAVGTVVVLPNRFEPQFGAAALYCTEADVVRTVKRYYRAGYAALVEAGRRYVHDHHRAASFTAHLERLLP